MDIPENLHLSIQFLGNEQKLSFFMSILYAQDLVKLEYFSSENISFAFFTTIYYTYHSFVLPALTETPPRDVKIFLSVMF